MTDPVLYHFDAAAKWVVNDAYYKPPEQWALHLKERWVPHLRRAVLSGIEELSVINWVKCSERVPSKWRTSVLLAHRGHLMRGEWVRHPYTLRPCFSHDCGWIEASECSHWALMPNIPKE